MSLSPPKESGCIVVYDEECFFCSNYVRMLKLRESMGNVMLISARDREKVEALHLVPADLNEGMALIIGDKRYFGPDAIHHMALLSTASGTFNALNRTIFKHPALARFLYPLLKLGRRTYLFLAGKEQIR